MSESDRWDIYDFNCIEYEEIDSPKFFLLNDNSIPNYIELKFDPRVCTHFVIPIILAHYDRIPHLLLINNSEDISSEIDLNHCSIPCLAYFNSADGYKSVLQEIIDVNEDTKVSLLCTLWQSQGGACLLPFLTPAVDSPYARYDLVGILSDYNPKLKMVHDKPWVSASLQKLQHLPSLFSLIPYVSSRFTHRYFGYA